MNDITGKIYKVFKSGNGYARTKDIIEVGIYNIYIDRFIEDGKVEKIKRGLYRWIRMNETSYQ